MVEESFKRKLTTMFSADVAGYSRLMAEDEVSTVKTLKAYREIMTELIKQHRGRVVDSPGDNVLAEFTSVVDAVQCAVSVQKELQARNAELPEDRRMAFRIGINLGDVIEEEDRIYGDGVNIAARLEALADPGGICISKTAFDQIETKLPLGYEYLGEQTVKNIAKPVGAYRVLMEPRVTVAEGIEKEKAAPVWRHKAILAGGVALVLVVVLALIWNFYFRRPTVEPASVEKMAYPLPDKPSIAVLPFVNMSEDKEQDFFCDGITEEIITALSKTPKIFVIARSSTFAYKGKPVKINQVAEELGVRYVLEGSVRKAGDRVRITAQLIDALTGRHLWAERYNRDLKDIFALQDEVTIKIIGALQVKLTDGEIARVTTRRTQNLEAYLKVLQAQEAFYTVTKEGMAQARRLCEEAISLDPDYAAAYGFVGTTHWMDFLLGSSKSPKESLTLAFKFLEKAKALGDFLPVSQLGYLYFMTRQYDKGIAECERAVTLAPNSGKAHIWMALVLHLAGRHEEAVRYAEQALRFDPLAPAWYLRVLGQAYSWVGRYEEAIAAYKKSLQQAPNDIFTHLHLTTTYTWAGRLEEARAQADEVLRINPKYSLEQAAKILLYKNQVDRDRYLDTLRKAGLPETPPLPLPDKPSIAVLPFTNMSGDPEQEYFSDGITEEIITALSKVPKLFVIARHSTFTYKGKSVRVQQVGRELGVRYVLEGSVRKAEDKVRITAQLIEATTDKHLWAERYDRDLRDIFAVQDEITMKIVTALRVKLTEGEQARLTGRDTENLDAYLRCLQVRELIEGAVAKEKCVLARRLAEEAIDLDPKYSEAYAVLAQTYLLEVWLGMSKAPRESWKHGVELLQKAIALDNSNARTHAILASAYVDLRQYNKAVAAVERAYALEPNSPDVLYRYGVVLYRVGRWEEAVRFYEEGLRLNPIPSNLWLRMYGGALRELERYDEAIAVLKKAIQQEPKSMYAHLMLAVAYSLAGREEEAREEAKEVLRINPNFSVKYIGKILPFKNPAHTNRLTTAMRKAGLPD
jgi:adenylate cyclase